MLSRVVGLLHHLASSSQGILSLELAHNYDYSGTYSSMYPLPILPPCLYMVLPFLPFHESFAYFLTNLNFWIIWLFAVKQLEPAHIRGSSETSISSTVEFPLLSVGWSKGFPGFQFMS